MSNASGWSYPVIVWLRLSLRWACAIGFLVALTPAMTLAQTGVTIASFNGSGLTLRAHINDVLKQNKLADGIVSQRVV